MKKAHEVLTEWTSDQISFKCAESVSPSIYTRNEFEALCDMMTGRKTGTALPMIEEAVNAYTSAAKRNGQSDAMVASFFKSFFSTRNIMKYRDIYELRYAIYRNAARIGKA